MNLLEPLRFDLPALAQRFALNHRCALCLAPLNANGNGVNCPTCGPVYEYTATSIHAAEKISNDRMTAQRDMRPAVKRTPKEILKELYNE
jgi:uncharacterized Zn finger protein (UPF0148 family)